MKLVVKSIFTPDHLQYCRTIESIESMPVIDARYLFIGWAKTGINQIKNAIKRFNNPEIHFYTKNFGKLKILRDVRDFSIKNGIEYIFYLDHDIYWPENNINPAFNLLDTPYQGMNIGIVVLDQKEDSRHKYSMCANTTFNGFNISSTNDPSALACGSFVIKSHIIPNLPLVSVYGIDDYLLCKYILDHGLKLVLLRDIFVHHPICSDTDYKKWKYNATLQAFNSPEPYLQNVNESVNYWNKKG